MYNNFWWTTVFCFWNFQASSMVSFLEHAFGILLIHHYMCLLMLIWNVCQNELFVYQRTCSGKLNAGYSLHVILHWWDDHQWNSCTIWKEKNYIAAVKEQKTSPHVISPISLPYCFSYSLACISLSQLESPSLLIGFNQIWVRNQTKQGGPEGDGSMYRTWFFFLSLYKG